MIIFNDDELKALEAQRDVIMKAMQNYVSLSMNAASAHTNVMEEVAKVLVMLKLNNAEQSEARNKT